MRRGLGLARLGAERGAGWAALAAQQSRVLVRFLSTTGTVGAWDVGDVACERGACARGCVWSSARRVAVASGARREWRNKWASRAKAERAGAPNSFFERRVTRTPKMFWNENEREKNKQKTNDFSTPCFYLVDSSLREVFSTPQSDERGDVETPVGMPDGLLARTSL